MSIGDIKTFDIIQDGLVLQVFAIDMGGGQVKFDIKCVSGFADINAIYWSDGDAVAGEGSTTGFDAKKDSSLNMNGSGEAWDGGLKLSSAGLGPAGWDKPTALTAGEHYGVTASLSWDSLDTFGLRATSTSTAGGSIKGVDGDSVVTAAPKVSVNDVTVTEGTDPTATFTVSLDHAYQYDVYVTYNTSDGTAANPGDYSSTSAILKIAAGSTSASLTVAITGDNVFEVTEHFNVNLTSVALDIPGTDLVSSTSFTADGLGIGTILDNDTVVVTHPEFYGLSKGFWGNPNGLLDWDLHQDASFEATFGVNRTWDDVAPFNNGTPALADVTLLHALDLGGGGQNQLAAQAVAALLNAADEDLHYKYSSGEIIGIVQNAFDGNDSNGWSIESAAAEFEYWNAHAGLNDAGHTYAELVNTITSDIY